MNEAAHHPIAKGLHWVMALMILGLLGVGLIMKELPLSPENCNSVPGTNGPASASLPWSGCGCRGG